jgi:hypothetical protein
VNSEFARSWRTGLYTQEEQTRLRGDQGAKGETEMSHRELVWGDTTYQ